MRKQSNKYIVQSDLNPYGIIYDTEITVYHILYY